MLIIRDEQMAAMLAVVRRGFEDRLIQWLAQKHPEKYADFGDAGMRRLVKDAIDKSCRHGIMAEPDIAGLAQLIMDFGPDFDTQPDCEWIRGVLDHPAYSGGIKVQLLAAGLTNGSRG